MIHLLLRNPYSNGYAQLIRRVLNVKLRGVTKKPFDCGSFALADTLFGLIGSVN